MEEIKNYELRIRNNGWYVVVDECVGVDWDKGGIWDGWDKGDGWDVVLCWGGKLQPRMTSPRPSPEEREQEALRMRLWGKWGEVGRGGQPRGGRGARGRQRGFGSIARCTVTANTDCLSKNSCYTYLGAGGRYEAKGNYVLSTILFNTDPIYEST